MEAASDNGSAHGVMRDISIMPTVFFRSSLRFFTASGRLSWPIDYFRCGVPSRIACALCQQ